MFRKLYYFNPFKIFDQDPSVIGKHLSQILCVCTPKI